MNARANTHPVAALAATLAISFLLAAAAHAGKPRFEELVLSDAKNGAQKNVFERQTPKIFITGKLLDVSSAVKVKCVWIAEKAEGAPPNYRIDGTELTARRGVTRANFSLSRPSKGWPPGNYRVDLFIDGKPAGAQRFTVKP